MNIRHQYRKNKTSNMDTYTDAYAEEWLNAGEYPTIDLNMDYEYARDELLIASKPKIKVESVAPVMTTKPRVDESEFDFDTELIIKFAVEAHMDKLMKGIRSIDSKPDGARRRVLSKALFYMVARVAEEYANKL